MCNLRSSTKAARAFLSSSAWELLILHLSAVASACLTIRHGSAVERASRSGWTRAEVALLYGDPTKEGLFALRLKVPKGYRVPTHTHPKPEIGTVLSGTVRLG